MEGGENPKLGPGYCGCDGQLSKGTGAVFDGGVPAGDGIGPIESAPSGQCQRLGDEAPPEPH